MIPHGSSRDSSAGVGGSDLPRLTPQAASRLSRVALQLQKQRLIPDVGRNRRHLHIPALHELGVDHHAAQAHVRQQAAITVALLDVELELDALAGDEPLVDRALVDRHHAFQRAIPGAFPK